MFGTVTDLRLRTIGCFPLLYCWETVRDGKVFQFFQSNGRFCKFSMLRQQLVGFETGVQPSLYIGRDCQLAEIEGIVR